MNIVTIYHGTALMLKDRIMEHESLVPKPGNRYVYVTTDYDRAKTYSRAWTAWALENGDEIEERFGFRPEPRGLVVKTILSDELLEKDPYSPDGEPDQYRVRGSLGLDDAEMIEIDFSEEFSDDAEITRAYAYWIGIGRANDDG